jgi:formylglycine-generating enzyme required for sulfatase activity
MNKYLYPLVLVVLLVTACMPPTLTPVASADLPQIELLSPPSGTRTFLHEEVEVESRSTDARGLGRIELWVDDAIYRVDEAEGQTSFHVIQRWRADSVGQHKLRVQALNVDGRLSQPVVISIEVLDPQALTPTSVPTDTPLPENTPAAAEAPTVTSVPSATLAATPTVAPTATPPPSEPTETPTATPTVTPSLTPTATKPPSTGPAGMVWIPAGKFAMGSNQDHVQQATEWCDCGRRQFEDELYMHEVQVSGFYIDKYEVTNRQFQVFADAAGYRTDAEKKNEARTWRTEYTSGKENHPVVWMSWNDAYAYCKWAGKRMPTEAEWEKAARGTDARLWPWGNNWDNKRLNMSEGGRKTTTPVGSFANGASPYGVMDMAGNVWEWVNDWYGAGYYQSGVTSDPKGPEGGEDRVLRGGGFNNGIHDVRVANRHKGGQAGYAPDHGFRCAR